MMAMSLSDAGYAMCSGCIVKLATFLDLSAESAVNSTVPANTLYWDPGKSCGTLQKSCMFKTSFSAWMKSLLSDKTRHYTFNYYVEF